MDFIKFEVHPSIRESVVYALGTPSASVYSHDDQRSGRRKILLEKWKVQGWNIVRKQEKFLEFSGNLPNYHLGISGRQLTFSQIEASLNKLSKEYDLPLESGLLRNLEINIDAVLEIPVSQILPLIKFYRTNLISQTRTSYKYKGSLEFQSTSRFKLYDREWVHRKIPGNILRAESHFNKMQAVSNKRLTLLDIQNRDFLKQQHSKLIERLNQTLIIEPLDNSCLSFDDRIIYQRWNDMQFINSIMQDNATKRKREKERLYNIQKKYGKGHHSRIVNAMNVASREVLST